MVSETNKGNNDLYYHRIHRMGRISGSLALLLILAVPMLISLYFDIFPPAKFLLAGILTVSMIYLPVALGEALIYSPMLGTGGTYLAFVTGNLMNLKVPCATMCMDVAGVKPSSREGEVISTIAVASSSLITTLIIFVGMLTIVPLRPILQSDFLAPALENILPALFGAFGAFWVLKQWKLAVAPLALAVMLSLFSPLPIGALIPILALSSIAVARLMYNRGWLGEIKKQENNESKDQSP